jgi:hypothetical protein
MIRRGFWLTAGAAAGIYGYRRVSALGRRVSAALNPAGPGAPANLAPRRARRGAVAVARETIRFTRDVREGMELYTARHSAPEGSTLGARDPEALRARDPEALGARDPEALRARDLEPARGLQTNHDPRPKDGR